MKILQFTVEQKRLSTAEAELWVMVRVENRDEAMELRGNLSGPRCPNVETIQLVYPIKPIRPGEIEADVLIGRIVIPEPNCWTPAMPFVYEGSFELWHEGKCIERQPIRAAFKAS